MQLRAIWQEMLKSSILDMCLNITNWRLQLHLPGTNEFIHEFTEPKMTYIGYSIVHYEAKSGSKVDIENWTIYLSFF